MAKFSDAEKQTLEQYVTDPTGDVFVVKNMPGLVGAAYARYSRAKGGFREVLLNEFIKEGAVDQKHADELIERILIAFGDDSVGELEGTHVSFENISMIATKEIEERRIGGSPIEQSTRYVFYDQKDDQGEYRYVKVPEIMNSPIKAFYQQTMDEVFDTYCRLIEPMTAYYQKLKTIDEAAYDILGGGQKQKYEDLTVEKDKKAFKRTYTFDLRTKACDTLRCLLPLSTKTNVGMFGNGRFFQNVISHLLTTPYQECQNIGAKALTELSKVIPQYVKRAKKNEYRESVENQMKNLAAALFDRLPAEPVTEAVTLIDRDQEWLAGQLSQGQKITGREIDRLWQESFDLFTLTHMIYPYVKHGFKQIRDQLRGLPTATKEKIITTYLGQRQTRRDRPYRALEAGYPYTFDLVTDWGTYKDLMRHRMNTQLRQNFSPKLGFTVPDDLKRAGFEDEALICHQKINKLYDELFNLLPHVACYATMHGHRVRWLLGMNDREAMHLTELRTIPQRH